MNIKDLLKRDKIIRHFGKRINIRRQFRQDAKDFSKYYVEMAEGRNDYRYSILLIVHSLEKGMCFLEPRPFGLDKVKELIRLLNMYPVSKRNDFEYELGISVLFAWRAFFDSHGWQEEKSYKEVSAFLKDKIQNPKMIAGCKEYRPNIENAIFNEDLFLSRHSVRDFKDVDIKIEDIQFALKCFVETPTACNRQMCRVYFITNQNIKELLNRVVIGVLGFNKKTVQYFVITYDLSSFAYSGERQQGMFNSGLCTMNFINGLHAKGIGSCCLQWSNKQNEDVEVRRALGLSDSERIAIVIGAGYYLEKNIIPCSVRRKTDEVFRIV